MENEIFGSVYERNAVIFEQGQPGHEMYIIQSGAIEVSRRAGDKEEVLAILGKGDFFGEMAIIRDEPRSATCRAIQRSRLLAITKENLIERGRKDPSIFLHFIRALIVRIKAVEKAAEAARRSSADESMDDSAPQPEDPQPVPATGNRRPGISFRHCS